MVHTAKSKFPVVSFICLFGCTDDSKDTTRHANKMACPSRSMSSAVSGLLGCIKALDQLCERTHGTSYELLYLEVACNASLEVMKPNAAIDFQG